MAFGYRRFGFKKSYRGKFSNKGRGYRFGRKSSWYNKNGSAAKQMAGFQNTQITLVSSHSFTFGDAVSGISSIFRPYSVSEAIVAAPMHIAMSNVYDQFRIRKVTLKITPTGAIDAFATGSANYYNLFTVLDRSGTATGATLATLQTYQSYKSTAYAGTPSNKPPTHYHSYYNSSLFQKSRWYDTKRTPEDAEFTVGAWGNAANATKIATFQFEWTFDVTYRGLRSDTSAISDLTGEPM